MSASWTAGFSSGIRSSALQQALGQTILLVYSPHRPIAIPPCIFLLFTDIPQSQLPVSSVVKIPLRQGLHPPLQPRPLHNVGGERRGGHGGRVSRGVVECSMGKAVVADYSKSMKQSRSSSPCNVWRGQSATAHIRRLVMRGKTREGWG